MTPMQEEMAHTAVSEARDLPRRCCPHLWPCLPPRIFWHNPWRILDCVPCSPEFLTFRFLVRAGPCQLVTSHQQATETEGYGGLAAVDGHAWQTVKLQFSPACATTHTHTNTLSVSLASGQSLSLLLDCSSPQVLLCACSTPPAALG